MAQRGKVRMPFLTRDGDGNITTIADDLAVHVMLVGATVSENVSGGITGGSTTVKVHHPGRILPGHKVYIIDDNGDRTGSFTINSAGVTLNGSQEWTLDINNTSGTDPYPCSAGYRIVLDHASVSESAYAEIRKGDLGDDDFGASDFVDTTAPTDGVPTDALIISTTTGEMEFWTPEYEVDLELENRVAGTHIGYIRDVRAGSRRPINDIEYYGAVTVAAEDQHERIQRAVWDAESASNEKRTVVIPGGTFEISEPVVITQPNVEIQMQDGTVIKATSGWTGGAAGLFQYQSGANDCVLQGGELQAVTLVSYCVENQGVGRLQVYNVVMSAGATGIHCSTGTTRLWVSNCYIRSMTTDGIYIQGTDYSKINSNQFGANTRGVHVDNTGSATDSFQTDISQNSFNGGGGTSIWLDGDSANPGSINDTSIIGNVIDSAGIAGSILVTDVQNLTIADNKIAQPGGIGVRLQGVATGSFTNNMIRNGSSVGLYVENAGANTTDMSIIGNQIWDCTSYGIQVEDSTRTSIIGNTCRGNGSDDIYVRNTATDNTVLGNKTEVGGLNLEATFSGEIGHNTEV